MKKILGLFAALVSCYFITQNMKPSFKKVVTPLKNEEVSIQAKEADTKSETIGTNNVTALSNSSSEAVNSQKLNNNLEIDPGIKAFDENVAQLMEETRLIENSEILEDQPTVDEESN